jgi:hypothetical protein
MDRATEGGGGCFGCGSIIAAILSFGLWHSWLWAFIHAFCGWFYVIYYAIFYWK